MCIELNASDIKTKSDSSYSLTIGFYNIFTMTLLNIVTVIIAIIVE